MSENQTVNFNTFVFLLPIPLPAMLPCVITKPGGQGIPGEDPNIAVFTSFHWMSRERLRVKKS